MPDVLTLFDRARALAVLTLLHSDGDPGDIDEIGGQYTLVRRGTGFKLRSHAQAHCIDIHFTDTGVLLVGWVRDAVFGSFEYGPEWQGDAGPNSRASQGASLRPQHHHGVQDRRKARFAVRQLCDVAPAGRRAWQIPRFTHPREVVDDMRNYAEDMTADEWRDDDAHLLVDLITPKLERPFWAHGVRDEGMRCIDARDVEWTDTGMTER